MIYDSYNQINVCKLLNEAQGGENRAKYVMD